MMIKDLKITVECTWCQGTGKVKRWNNDQLEPCPICNGSGKCEMDLRPRSEEGEEE